MDGLLSTQRHRGIWTWTAVKSNILVLISMYPVTTKGTDDRAARNWPHPSLAATLDIAGPTAHHMYSTWAAQ